MNGCKKSKDSLKACSENVKLGECAYICDLGTFHCLWGFCVGLYFWYALLYVLSSFAIILTRKRKLVALLLLAFGCLVTVNVL